MNPIFFIDQTLNSGCLSTLDSTLFSEACSALKNLPVTAADIDLPAAPALISLPDADFLRIRIKNIPDEVNQVAKLRPSKVVISYMHRAGECPVKALDDTLTYLTNHTGAVSLCIENAPVISIKEMRTYLEIFDKFKINSLIYQDSQSMLDPFTVEANLKAWQRQLPIELEFHAHNSFGLATANALAAIGSGVRQIAVSVGGIGKFGHAAIEEVMMASKLSGLPVDTTQLAGKCANVLYFLGICLPTTKAVIGQNIFAHESGIHVDGVIKHPSLYELFPPEEVGLSRKLVIGKHTGLTSLKAKLRELSITLDDETAGELLTIIRRISIEQKKPPDDQAIHQLVSKIV